MKNRSLFFASLLVCSGCTTVPHFEPVGDVDPQSHPSSKYAVLLKQRLRLTVDTSRVEYRPGPHEKESGKYRLLSKRPSVANPAIRCPADTGVEEVRFSISSLEMSVESVPDPNQVYVVVADKNDDKSAQQGVAGNSSSPSVTASTPVVSAQTVPQWTGNAHSSTWRREANLVRWSAEQGPADVKLRNTLGSLQTVQQARLQLATERGNVGALVQDEVILRTKLVELDKQENDLIELFVGTTSETRATSTGFLVEPTSGLKQEEKILIGHFSPCAGVLENSNLVGPQTELSLLVTPDRASLETLENLERRETSLPSSKERSGPPVRIPLETTVTILLGDARLAMAQVQFSQKGLLMRALRSNEITAKSVTGEELPMGSLVWVVRGDGSVIEQRRDWRSVLRAP